MRLLVPVLLCGSCPFVAASDLHPVDLRMNFMLAPETDGVEMTYYVDNIGTSMGTDSVDAGFRFEAGLVTRLAAVSDTLSLVGGAWFFYSDQETDEVAPGERELSDATGPMEYTTMGVDLYIAMNWQMNRHLELEFGPFVGVGTARFADRAVAAGNPEGRVSESGSGEYEEAGFNLSLLIRNTSHSVLVGLGVKYIVSNGEADLTWDLEGSSEPLHQDVEVHVSGFAPYLTLGLTF